MPVWSAEAGRRRAKYTVYDQDLKRGSGCEQVVRQSWQRTQSKGVFVFSRAEIMMPT